MHVRDDHLRALVCGGASGIGLACAELLAALGAELFLTDYDGTALTRAADRVGACSAFCDSISQSSVAVFAADIVSRFDSLDLLINCAGSGYVRALSMLRMTQAMLPLLRAGTGPRFVFNVAPVAGSEVPDGMFPYSSSIVAYEQLADALAEQVRGTSVQVVNLAPSLKRPAPVARAPASERAARHSIDERKTAERIADWVKRERPSWRGRPPAIGRRA